MTAAGAGEGDGTPFSDRLARRARAWWGADPPPHAGRTRRGLWRALRYLPSPHGVHRLRDRLVLRSRDDPDERWHCCPQWQRTLGNKWNSREFAQKHGCRVPALYWYGRRIGGLPLASLPDHYVVRPTFRANLEGVYVLSGGVDLLRNARYSGPDLMAELKRAHGPISPTPVLVEEFVRTESGEYHLPVEYKVHTFGESVGAIEVIQRPAGAGRRAQKSFYSIPWGRLQDRMSTSMPAGSDVRPPRSLDEMAESAKRLGAACGTYVRLDFYSTDQGCVFGELAYRPAGGYHFTPFAERYFDNLWRQAFPDQH